MNRARSTIIRAASSKLNTPATQAAAISPTLWPTTAAGCTPHDFHSSASATCIAKMAGCAISVRCICEVPSWRQAPRAGKSSHGLIAASHASIVLRKTGSCAMSSRPMPHHCGPWPLMTKAMRGGCSRRGVKAVRTFGAA